ncbi:hypothetical protein D3C74_14440 [compost metagenome]
MVEAKSLFRTPTAWRRELLMFVRMRLTHARSETANLTAKDLRRNGRGYRNTIIIGFECCCRRRVYGPAEHLAPRLTYKSRFKR